MRIVFRFALAGALVGFVTFPCHAETRYICRNVGSDWLWFGDHAALSISYATRGPFGRTYEVGMGLSVNGSPWGSRVVYAGDAEFSAYGIGSLHIRRADDGPDFEVCASVNGLEVIPIIKNKF